VPRPRPPRSKFFVSGAARLFDPVEEALAAQIEFPINQRWRSAEAVFEMVNGQGSIFTIVPQDNGGPIPAGDIDPVGGADRGGKDKVFNAPRRSGSPRGLPVSGSSRERTF